MTLYGRLVEPLEVGKISNNNIIHSLEVIKVEKRLESHRTNICSWLFQIGMLIFARIAQRSHATSLYSGDGIARGQIVYCNTLNRVCTGLTDLRSCFICYPKPL